MVCICSLYSWWQGFGSSSLATLPLGFSCGFICTSACGLSSGVCSWGCPGGLGFASLRARRGGGAAAWVTGVLVAPGTQGSWWLGQQEIQCSRRVTSIGQYAPVFLPREPPSLTEKPGRPQSTGSESTGDQWSDPVHIDTRLSLPGAALPQWELSMKVVQLLGLQGPWQCQVCKDTDCLHRRSYGPIRVFFWASCSWQSEGLFGWSCSVAPPVQTLRGLPSWDPSLLFGASRT